jgi:hypothetical protein
MTCNPRILYFISAWKKGRFDVEYFYDHENRLMARKDNHGNTTQFLYGDVAFPKLVTHIYSPRYLLNYNRLAKISQSIDINTKTTHLFILQGEQTCSFSV